MKRNFVFKITKIAKEMESFVILTRWKFENRLDAVCKIKLSKFYSFQCSHKQNEMCLEKIIETSNCFFDLVDYG